MSKILESDINAVRAMREAGATLEAIATCLKRTYASVQSIARENDILLKNKPEKPNGRKYDSGRLIAKETTLRPCLCCKKQFESQGAHNRLCGGCRSRDVTSLAY